MKTVLAICLLGMFALMAFSSESPAPAEAPTDPEKGKVLYATCQTCHGVNAEGNASLFAPRLAGLPEWYLKRQIVGFKEGYRGASPKDMYSMMMRPMAMKLEGGEDVSNVIEYIKTLEAPAPVATVKGGDATRGQEKYVVCATCHGADGQGQEALNAPPLTGQHDWYLLRQLEHFKNGLRGAHADDAFGMQMVPMAAMLDEQAMKDVVAYIQTL